MGRVKFIFPNDEGIYLHDTPERELLKKSDRHFSNGCIRLENAAELGRWLLRKPIRTSRKEPEHAVPVPAPVTVYLTYLTANTATDTGIAFRDDVTAGTGEGADWQTLRRYPEVPQPYRIPVSNRWANALCQLQPHPSGGMSRRSDQGLTRL